jgi:hypothetical protein
MGVRDDGPIYRLPWIDVEIAWIAVETAIGEGE